MSALDQNIALAADARRRREAAIASGALDPFQAAQSDFAGPGMDALLESLKQKEEGAQSAGLNFRAVARDIAPQEASVPQGTGAGLALSPDAVRTLAAGEAVDRAKAAQLAQDEAAKREQQGDINDLYSAYQQHVLNSVLAPPMPTSLNGALPTGTSVTTAPNGTVGFTMRGQAPTSDVDRLSQLPGAMKANMILPIAEQNLRQQDEALKQTQATGPGTLPDFILRVARAKGVPVNQLTPDDIDAARQRYLDTTAAAGTMGPKAQQGLEQKYRDIVAKEISSRSGDLGTQNDKISQATHLLALFDQNKDKNGNYTLPSQQLSEAALGLANLIAGKGGATQEMTKNLTPQSLKGDAAKALQYITGEPQTGSTQDLLKQLHDSIQRQGEIAQGIRNKHLDEIRAMAPTDLAADRKAALDKALGLTTIPIANAAAQNAPPPLLDGSVLMHDGQGGILHVPQKDIGKALAAGAQYGPPK